MSDKVRRTDNFFKQEMKATEFLVLVGIEC